MLNKNIDRQLWDACINASPNNLIYTQSFFLDAMVKNWDALIINNYEAVLPLPWKKKWGIKYLYQPAFVQQSGLFSAKKSISFDDVFKEMQQHFKYIDMPLNFLHGNNIYTTERINFILDLNRPYETIFTGYKNDLKKNLKIAVKQNWNYDKSLKIMEAVFMYEKYYATRIKSLTENDFKHFKKMCDKIKYKGNVFTRSITGEKNNIAAIALFLFDGKRIYNVMNTTTTAGKAKAANHFLLDNVIKEFAGNDYILDFEGSDKKGIKSFYEKFGPENQAYFHLKYNNLSPLIRWIKK